MRNAEILKHEHSISEFHRPKNQSFQIAGVGSVETIHHKSPEVAKCEMQNPELGTTKTHEFMK
jgi:hypothetical protein